MDYLIYKNNLYINEQDVYNQFKSSPYEIKSSEKLSIGEDCYINYSIILDYINWYLEYKNMNRDYIVFKNYIYDKLSLIK